MADTQTIQINRMPSATWSWLKMNSASLSVDYLSPAENLIPAARGTEGVSYAENGAEEQKKLPVLAGGAGESAASLFASAVPVSIVAKKGTAAEKPVVLSYALSAGQNGLAAQVIRAEENSSLTVIILCSSEKTDGGFNALRTQIVAEPYAKVHVIKVQLLGEKFVQIDDTESRCAENAHIEVTHIVLGGAKTYVGVGNDLAEYKASFKSRLAYYCRNEQELDMNYVVLHHGKKTECRMDVGGTLTDSSKKTYRGTIDFINGCGGSKGVEQEETLLLSEKTTNNSIPIILCDEEDVSGEHGASIGRLSDEILFYMKNRGIGKQAAENLIARAKVQSTASYINDEEVLSKTELFMDSIFGEL